MSKRVVKKFAAIIFTLTNFALAVAVTRANEKSFIILAANTSGFLAICFHWSVSLAEGAEKERLEARLAEEDRFWQIIGTPGASAVIRAKAECIFWLEEAAMKAPNTAKHKEIQFAREIQVVEFEELVAFVSKRSGADFNSSLNDYRPEH